MSDAKATIAARTWSPSSWRSLESLQMASYEAADAPEKIFDKLSKLPPLVQSTEVDALKELLAAAARGERFIVQGGDCAERFMDCETDRLWRQLGVLFQMGEIVSKSTGKGAVRIARIAGQYGKPRSSPVDYHQGQHWYFLWPAQRPTSLRSEQSLRELANEQAWSTSAHSYSEAYCWHSYMTKS